MNTETHAESARPAERDVSNPPRERAHLPIGAYAYSAYSLAGHAALSPTNHNQPNDLMTPPALSGIPYL